MFQAVRSPGNINYKRKEQWKTFHPRIPCPLEPRRRHCLRCTPIFVSTTVQGQHVFDGDEENSQTGVSCLSACEMKEEEKRSLGKMEERRGCSRSGQPTVTETVRRRPTLFSRYTCRILNRDYQFRQLSFEIRTTYPNNFFTYSLTFLYLIHSPLFSPIFSLPFALASHENMHASVSLLPLRRATSNETSGFRNFSKISEPLPCIREFKNAYPPSSVPVDTIVSPFRAPLHPLSFLSNLSLPLSRCPFKRRSIEEKRKRPDRGKERERIRDG